MIVKHLNDPFIINLYGFDMYNNIQKWLNGNIEKLEPKFEPKENEIIENISPTDSLVQTIKSYDLEKKMRHIFSFAYIFLNYPSMSCKEIADFYNETNTHNEKVDENYVSECLSSKQNFDILTNNLWDTISAMLKRKEDQKYLIETLKANKSKK